MKNECSDYTVRIRFRLLGNKCLDISDVELVIGSHLEYGDVLLKSADNKSSIKDAEWLVVRVSGFSSEEIAKSSALEIEGILCRSLAHLNLGADFGRRTPGGGFFSSYLEGLSEKADQTVLNDEVGAMIYPTELKPIVARVGNIGFSVSVQATRLLEACQLALENCHKLSERERMAFDLFTMAHKVNESADARFVLLFTAIETLIEPSDRPEVSIEHVEKLIKFTKEAELPPSEAQSLVGTLSWLKAHSIRSSGKAFIRDNLGGNEYGGVVAEKFFIDCYNLRNRLLHGQSPHVDWLEVSNIVGPLEVMVSNLLSGGHNETKQ